MKNNKFPLFETLTIILVVAKLMDVFTYSWWWVFAPIWMPILFAAGVIFIGFTGLLIKAVIEETIARVKA